LVIISVWYIPNLKIGQYVYYCSVKCAVVSRCVVDRETWKKRFLCSGVTCYSIYPNRTTLYKPFNVVMLLSCSFILFIYFHSCTN